MEDRLQLLSLFGRHFQCVVTSARYDLVFVFETT